MTERTQAQPLNLSLRETIGLYLILTQHEDELDDTQRDILARVSGNVYDELSLEEIEDIHSFYKSL